MSRNKATVERCIDGFNKGDHAQSLSCLTDDIEWFMPGAFHIFGKEAYDNEIKEGLSIATTTVKLTRMFEENDVVVTEGSIYIAYKNGDPLNAVFCEVYEMEGGLIKKIVTYLIKLTE